MTFTQACIRAITALALIVLYGCGSSPRAPETSTSTLSTVSAVTSQQLTLDELLDTLDTNIFNSADTSVPAEQVLQILPVAINEQNWRIAKALIDRTDRNTLTLDQYGQFTLAELQYLNLSKDFANANKLLNSYELNSKLPFLKVADQVALSLTRAETYYGLSRYLASAKERIFIEGLIDDSQLRETNTERLWSTLLEIPKAQLENSLQRATSNNERRWLELALIYLDENSTIKDKKQQLENWQQTWKTNLSSNFFNFGKLSSRQLTLPSVESLIKSRDAQYRTIAFMLPLSGPLASAGQAIRDGVLHSHLARRHPAKNALSQNIGSLPEPTLLFFDSQSKSVSALYDDAINAGANMIIGPLEKAKVAELFTMPTDVPILTLNFLNEDLPPPLNVVQFGLAVEDEAIQLAAIAEQSQNRRIMILNIDKEWAVRAGDAFEKAWSFDSRQSLTRKTLSIRENFSKEIASSLLLLESENRLRDIENVLSQRLAFTPRRRHDIDLIILFADESNAKAIKPLLAYHYAGDIAVIANSNAFGGTEQTGQQQDIEGLLFNEMPWIINGKAPSKQDKSLQRLYAMGMDAYLLHSQLDYLKLSPNNRIAGNTGNLSMKDHRIVRELALAKIDNGKVELADRTELLSAIK